MYTLKSGKGWEQCHCPPLEWSPWVSEAHGRPRSTRDNTLPTQYILEPIPTGAILDCRSPRDMFGAPTRMDARQEHCCSRTKK